MANVKQIFRKIKSGNGRIDSAAKLVANKTDRGIGHTSSVLA